MSYFPETGNYDRNKIKFEIDFPNYATKSDVKKQQVLTHQNFL